MFDAKKILTTGGGILVVLVAVICINIIASKLAIRGDVTAEDIYTLSDGTKKILGKLEDSVDARLYFSRSHKELPPIIKTYATRVEEVLNEYASYSNGKIKVGVVDPKPDTDEEEWARKYGVNGVSLPSGESLYFGVVFLSGDKEVAIPYLDPRREEFLEYDLSEAVVRVFQSKKPKVGIMSSLPVMASMPQGMPGQPQGPQSWMLVEYLQRNFEVTSIPPSSETIDQELDVLIIIHPKDFADNALYAIDQYVVGGGRLIVAVDPLSRLDMRASGHQARMMGQMPKTASDLGKLFDAWDIEFTSDKLAGDLNLATRVSAGGAGVTYPFYINLVEKSFSQKSVVTANLKQMMYTEGGAFNLKPDSSYIFEPLLETSEDSGVTGSQLAGFMGPLDFAKEFKSDGKKRVLAGILKGKFKSAFPAGRPGGAKDGDKAPLKEAGAETSIVLIGDSDLFYDANTIQKMQLGMQVIARPLNDNLNFLFNAVDFLGGSQDLISIRSRGKIARPFKKVAELQRLAQQRWKEEEQKLSDELQDLQKKLNALQSARTDSNRFTLSSEQQAEIKSFREKERQVRKQRRMVRKNLREGIESLGHRLIAANMLVVPLLVSVFGFGIFMRRVQRMKR